MFKIKLTSLGLLHSTLEQMMHVTTISNINTISYWSNYFVFDLTS